MIVRSDEWWVKNILYLVILPKLDLKTPQPDLTVIKNVHFLSRQIVVPHIDFPTGYLPVYLSLVLALSDFPEWNLLFVLFSLEYTQYPIIRNGLIRNNAEFLGKFKKQALGRSNLRNASKNLRNGQCSDFQS